MAYILVSIIAFLAASCHVGEGVACDFDINLCNYTQDTTDQFDWIRQAGATFTNDTGPDADHTYGNAQGYYVYSGGSFPEVAGEVSRLIGAPTPYRGRRCLRFYYYMYGQNVGTLRVKARVNNSTSTTTLWSRSGSQGSRWFRGLVSFTTPWNGNAGIIFEAVVGPGNRSDIALDDIDLTYGACPLESLSCDFERGWCGFTQDYTDNFNFRRISGGTPTVTTGPRVDHTFDNTTGRYIYIETSNFIRQPGHKARIISPRMRGIQSNDPETFCVVFWYYMHGESVGDLNVYLRNQSSTSLGQPIWGLSGTRGDLWRGAEVEIKSTEDFNVVFEAVRGSSGSSDIAIDDIDITNYGCPGHHIIKNESSVSCDFEEAEICYYSQDPTNDLDWRWKNRGSPDGFTGPHVDHTTGNELGFFMYVSSDAFTSAGDRARLLSPVARRQSSSSCVEFWFHMFGQDVEILNVYIKPEDGPLPTTPAWTRQGNQGSYWHRATIIVPAFTNDFRIVFEGIPGNQDQDDIAIDDVTLHEAMPCPIFSTIPPIATTQPMTVTALDCDFENDFCGFEQEDENDDADWAREQGTSVPSYSRGTHVDHTLKTNKGYYVTFDPSKHQALDRYDVAILVSPFVKASTRARCLQFYAYLDGNYVDYLNLYIRPWGQTLSLDPQFSIYGDIADEWRLYGLTLPPSNENFHILFEANVGYSRYNSKAAIDDIILVDGMCATEGPPVTPPWGADCDFEQAGVNGTFCGAYRQLASDSFDWTWHQGSTGSSNTGPTTDHTLGTPQGHYMYIETSLPLRPRFTAILSSPLFNSQNTDLCLRFYYHAMGEGDIGTLSVTLKDPEVISATTVPFSGVGGVELFRVTGSKGDRWIPVNIDIPNELTGNDDFEIHFNGIKGTSLKGDLAIDDIIILRQPCGGFPTEGRCSFEQGLEYCGFSLLRLRNDVEYPVWMWYDSIGSEASPISNIPSSSFMYAVSNPGNISTVMYSETYDLHDRDHCLSARVLLLNADDVRLSVALQRGNNGRRSTVDNISGQTSREWETMAWTIPSDFVDGPFRIVFSATIGGGSRGIIAMDDVNFTPQSGLCGEDGSGTSSIRSGSSSENPGLIAGIIIVLLLLIAVIVVAFMIRLRTTYTGKLPIMSFHKKQQDEQPVVDHAYDTQSGITATSFTASTADENVTQA